MEAAEKRRADEVQRRVAQQVWCSERQNEEHSAALRRPGLGWTVFVRLDLETRDKSVIEAFCKISS